MRHENFDGLSIDTVVPILRNHIFSAVYELNISVGTVAKIQLLGWYQPSKRRQEWHWTCLR